METIADSKQLLVQLKKEMNEELEAIIAWWWKHMPDHKNGGFYGSLDNQNIPDTNAPKGIVLNSRILWTFSSAYHFTKNKNCLELARRAYDYITTHFADQKYGGVYWSVDTDGNILDGRKQIYGLAFCIYGLSAYYQLTADDKVLAFAKKLFASIEQHSHDKISGGYFEAFTRNWKAADDLRLSDKDANESKTMNTHLHVIEAYASLYQVWKDETLHSRLLHLLELFEKHFINKENFHLNLFFDDDWNLKSSLQSFGHDIEAAWLLQQCAETTEHEGYIKTFRKLAVKITDAATEGLDPDGGLWYEYEPAQNLLIKEKHNWCQAEAMIGFLNAYQLTGQQHYLDKAIDVWSFVKKYIKDSSNGEWFWGVTDDYSIMPKEKAGFWKCPYHNGRASMEIINRVSTL